VLSIPLNFKQGMLPLPPKASWQQRQWALALSQKHHVRDFRFFPLQNMQISEPSTFLFSVMVFSPLLDAHEPYPSPISPPLLASTYNHIHAYRESYSTNHNRSNPHVLKGPRCKPYESTLLKKNRQNI